MKINLTGILLAAMLAMALAPAANASGRLSVDLESGLAIPGYNDIRIPGDEGTEFSFVDDLDADNEPFVRARVNWRIGERHLLSALVAPLRFSAIGSFDREVRYEDRTFQSGVPIDASYRFDSYRLTYRYRLYQSSRINFGLGFTAKVRDAEIRLEDPDGSAAKANTGFVPLINFAFEWDLPGRFDFILRGDALAAPQGRAEDILGAFTYSVTDRLALRAGYRILEGGADNDDVYNFSLVHYVSFGVTATL